MLIIKKAARFILRSLAACVTFLLVYLLVIFLCSRISVGAAVDNDQSVAIYIKSNGVHTDIVMPVHTAQIDWSREIKYANTALTDTDCAYLAVGWGDKGFYLQTPTWADLKLSVAFRAAFGLSTTAIHATYYKALAEDEHCHKIMISPRQYQQLISFVGSSFQKDANGHMMHIATNANYGKADAFYEANGRYSMFYTCNSWANNALRACGQRCCLWTIFDTPIFDKYK